MDNEEKKHIVYKTTNLVNGKMYIGKHTTETPYEFDGYFGSGVALKRAIKKHGQENFKRETLFVFATEEDAYAKEKELVTVGEKQSKQYYNLCGGGVGGGEGENSPWFNRTHSDEARQKISDGHTGKVLSESTKQKISLAKQGELNWWFGKHHSDLSKEKMSAAQKGKVFSEEHKRKIKENHADVSGENHPNYGKIFSKERRRNLSIGHLGKDVFYSRIRDIATIDKSYGWKSKLAQMWGLHRSSAFGFIRRFGAINNE